MSNQAMEKFMRNFKKYKKGFGILEVLVSSVIIITILAGLVFIGRAAYANSLYTQQKAQAVYLAQEGIELVRQMRDTNWIDGNNATEFDDILWKDSAHSALTSVNSGVIYIPDYDSVSNHWGLKTPANESDKNVQILNSETNTGDTFKREILIESIDSTKTILPGSGTNDVQKNLQSFKVTVTVKWSFNKQAKSIAVSEIITNWRPNY